MRLTSARTPAHFSRASPTELCAAFRICSLKTHSPRLDSKLCQVRALDMPKWSVRVCARIGHAAGATATPPDSCSAALRRPCHRCHAHVSDAAYAAYADAAAVGHSGHGRSQRAWEVTAAMVGRSEEAAKHAHTHKRCARLFAHSKQAAAIWP